MTGDYGFPGSKLRSRLSMTLWMLLSCLYLFGETVEVTERFTYPGSEIHVSAGCEQRSIDGWIGLGESRIHWIMGAWCWSYLCRWKKVRVLRSLVLPVSLYGCET